MGTLANWSTKIQDAYVFLLDLVANGVEYPDAEWRMTARFKLSPYQTMTIRRRYDDRY